MSEEEEVVRHLPALIERSAVVLVAAMDLNTAQIRMREFQDFIEGYLEESKDGGATGDYGVIAGTKKKTLLKSGADKLCEVYALYDEYEIKSTIDWATGLFDYEITCILKSRRDDSKVGTGLGCCSSFESKYRWRDSQRKCPQCGAEAIIKGKDFNNTGVDPGWLCWAKKGGCGTKFKAGDKSIEGQVIGRVENPDIVDIKNTVLKMAKKRAKIDATIGATRSSGILTQDLDEVPMDKRAVEVARTTEDIPLPAKQAVSGPAQSGGASEPRKETEAPKSRTSPPVPPARTLGFDPDAPIDKTRQVALHKAFREAIGDEKARTHADTFLRDWLFHQGYKDADGAGSTKSITMGLFEEVKAAACLFASGLK